MSSFMADSPTSDCQRTGSPRTSFAWRMEFSSSTGMSFRTKQHVKPPRAAFPCLVRSFLTRHSPPLTLRKRRKRTQNSFRSPPDIKSALQGERLRGKPIGDENGSNLQSDRDNEAGNFSPCREACRGTGRGASTHPRRGLRRLSFRRRYDRRAATGRSVSSRARPRSNWSDRRGWAGRHNLAGWPARRCRILWRRRRNLRDLPSWRHGILPETHYHWRDE